jgi:hypothetical protein
LWIVSLTENDIKIKSTHIERNSFKEIAGSYKGITGNTTLNVVGDRKFGDYDFRVIRNTNNNNHDTFTWEVVGKFINNITNKEGSIQKIVPVP